MVSDTPALPERHRLGMGEKQWVAFTSVIAAIVLTATKLVVGLWTNSLGILSEALHSALDFIAAGMTLYAVRKAAQPPDADHHYGHTRIENLSAFIETVLLLITVIWIFYEAARRIIFMDVVIETNIIAFGVIVFAIIVDFSRSRALKRAAEKYDSQALEADALHFSTDILSSSVVLIGLIFAHLGFPLADPFAAIGVGIVVLYLTWKLGRETLDILLDRAPYDLVHPIRNAVEKIDGIKECSRVRLRKAGHVTFVDIVCHLERSIPFEKASQASAAASRIIGEIVDRADVIVHMDLASQLYPNLVEQIREDAHHFKEISEIDSIQSFEINGQVSLTIDIRVDPEESLEKAHDLVTVFENYLKENYPMIKEITTHIEPTRPQPTVSADLTKAKKRIVQLVQASPLLHNCHNVQFYNLGPDAYGVTLHCNADSELTVEKIHHATTLLEDEIREALPSLINVVIHVEPKTKKQKQKSKKNT